MTWDFMPSRITLLISSVNIRYSHHQIRPNQLWSKQQYRESSTLQSFSACTYHLYKMKPAASASFKILLIIAMVHVSSCVLYCVYLYSCCVFMYDKLCVYKCTYNIHRSCKILATCLVQRLFTKVGFVCV